jgi:hypothetical protein
MICSLSQPACYLKSDPLKRTTLHKCLAPTQRDKFASALCN